MNCIENLITRGLGRIKCDRFYSQFIKPGDLVYDIGANTGDKSKIFSRLVGMSGKVIAIEPQSSCIRELRNKFSKTKNIELVQKAVGRTEDILDMHICNVNTLSSLSTDWIKSAQHHGRFRQEADWAQTEKVEVITLDSLISEYGMPKFIKIDVEGYEKEVLLGLSMSIPCYLSIEFLPELVEEARQCLECLEKVGHILCNYSLDGSMELALDGWVSADEVIRRIKDLEKGRDWGDIYIKLE